MIPSLHVRIGYWLRPFDMLLDKRRWRWQHSGHARQRQWERKHGAVLDQLMAEVKAELDRREQG